MTRDRFDERRSPTLSHSDLDDFAAELTEAAFPIALQHGAGVHWLDRKLQLWNAMTETVSAWSRHAHQPLPIQRQA